MILGKTPERFQGCSEMVAGSSDSYSYVRMKEQCGHWETKHEMGLLLL